MGRCASRTTRRGPHPRNGHRNVFQHGQNRQHDTTIQCSLLCNPSPFLHMSRGCCSRTLAIDSVPSPALAKGSAVPTPASTNVFQPARQLPETTTPLQTRRQQESPNVPNTAWLTLDIVDLAEELRCPVPTLLQDVPPVMRSARARRTAGPSCGSPTRRMGAAASRSMATQSTA